MKATGSRSVIKDLTPTRGSASDPRAADFTGSGHQHTPDLMALLTLDPVKPDAFLAPTADNGWGRIYGGQVLFAGTPEALVADENVKRLYLGENFTL